MTSRAAFAEQWLKTWDGLEIVVRGIRPGDVPLMQDAMHRMSAETRRLRFFTPWRELPPELAEHLANVDFDRRAALVATLPDDPAIRAIARYDRTEKREAEVAFAVEDSFQGRGIGSLLLRLLARVAHEHGIDTLVADTLAENATMLSVFRDSGFPMDLRTEHEVVHVRLDIIPEKENPGTSR